MLKTSEERKRWSESMRACALCRVYADWVPCRYCDLHRARLDDVVRSESLATIERARREGLPPLPKPAPLPPRRPT